MGFCALTVGLILAGFTGSVALADTGADASGGDGPAPADTAQTVSTTHNESSDTTVATGVVDTVPTLIGSFGAGTLLDTKPETTSHEETARQAPETQSTGLAGPMAIGVSIGSQPATDAPATVTTEKKGSDTTPAVVEKTGEPQVVVSTSTVTAPSQPPKPPAAEVAAAPVADASQPDPPQQAQPVAKVAASAPEPAPSTQPAPPTQPASAAAPVVIGTAAAGDIIRALTYLFITLPGEHALALPDQLLSLLGFPLIGDARAATLTAGGVGGGLLAGGVLDDARAHLTAPQPVQAGWPELVRAAGRRQATSSPLLQHPAAEGVSVRGMKEERLSVGLSDSVVPDRVRSALRHAVGAVLAPLSLLILALMASPGVAGMVLLGAAGTFVGYRQARAASLVRAVGIARFVKAGPLGVVRSGRLVAVHSRSASGRREPSHEAASLETVA